MAQYTRSITQTLQLCYIKFIVCSARRNTPSIEDTDGAAAATVGGNVRGTMHKSDTDITIPQPLDKK